VRDPDQVGLATGLCLPSVPARRRHGFYVKATGRASTTVDGNQWANSTVMVINPVLNEQDTLACGDQTSLQSDRPASHPGGRHNGSTMPALRWPPAAGRAALLREPVPATAGLLARLAQPARGDRRILFCDGDGKARLARVAGLEQPPAATT